MNEERGKEEKAGREGKKQISFDSSNCISEKRFFKLKKETKKSSMAPFLALPNQKLTQRKTPGTQQSQKPSSDSLGHRRGRNSKLLDPQLHLFHVWPALWPSQTANSGKASPPQVLPAVSLGLHCSHRPNQRHPCSPGTVPGSA